MTALPATQLHTVGDIQLAYVDSGGPGTPVLLVHAAYLSKQAWEAQWTALSAHHRVIAVDLRGHGESSAGIWPFSISLVAEDLAGLLDALGIRRAHVCGHSLGGMAALHLALQHPDRVRSLVLVDTTASVQSTVIQAVTAQLAWPVIALTGIRRQATLMTRALAPNDQTLQRTLLRQILTFEDRPEAYRVIWDAMMSFELLADLPRITCPTLILIGGRHPVTHGQARRLQAGLPDAELRVIPRAGHLVTMEQPAVVNDLLLRFWNERSGPPPLV